MNMFTPFQLRQLIVFLSVFIAESFAIAATTAPSAVKVTQNKFEDCFNFATNKWIQWELELEGVSNPDETALNKKFLTNIMVEATLAYKNPDQQTSKTTPFVFFRSQLTVSALEIGSGQKKRKVYFFMPGDVVEMFRLDRKAPYGLLRFKVGGKELPFDAKRDLQGKLTEVDLKGFEADAEANIKKTEGMLLPITDVPWYVMDKVDQKLVPSFITEKKK